MGQYCNKNYRKARMFQSYSETTIINGVSEYEKLGAHDSGKFQNCQVISYDFR